MRFRSLSPFALALTVAALLTGNPANARAEDVKLDGSDLQVVLDQLFGTPDTDGLLEGTQSFGLHAENVVINEEQAALFFVPSETNTSDITDLILKAEGIKGAELKIAGSVDGDSFELKLSGKQVKIEGLVLTQIEFDALIARLQAMPGLHEAKIGATVDGEILIAKLQNVPGRVKIEHRGFVDDAPRPVPLSGTETTKSDARLAVSDRGERSEKSGRAVKIERIERPEKVERLERPEKVQRVERPVKIERIERPEVSGKVRG